MPYRTMLLALALALPSCHDDENLALEFRGDGGDVTFSVPLVGDRTVFTFELWFKPFWPPVVGAPLESRSVIYVESYDQGGPADGATRNFMFVGHDDPDNAFDAVGAATLTQFPGDGAPSVYTAPLVEAEWQHLAFVRDGDALRIYVDGALSADGPALTYSGPAPNHFRLGKRVNPVSGDEWCRAVIDEVRVSSVARYAADFTPARTFAPDADTLSLWHFDEPRGVAVFDAAGNAPAGALAPGVLRVDADR